MIASDIIILLTAKGVGGKLFDSFEDLRSSFSGVRSIITPYGGSEPIRVQEDPDKRIDIPRFQVMTQGTNPTATEREAYRVQNVLARVQNQIINGVFYLSITPLQPPFFLKWEDPIDGVRAITYEANYEAKKQPFLAA